MSSVVEQMGIELTAQDVDQSSTGTDDSGAALLADVTEREARETSRGRRETGAHGDGAVLPSLDVPGTGSDETTGQGMPKLNLPFTDVKHALANPRNLVRTLLLATMAYLLVLLPQRPAPPFWVTHGPALDRQEARDMTIEMVVAFCMVTVLYLAVLFYEFVYTSAPRIKGGWYAMIGPITLAFVISGWMVLYTLHIPFSLQRGWRWAITAGLSGVVFLAATLVGSRRVVARDDVIIEV
uniref:Uncharacterized protein n=1 Tax=Oryza punctata TaxID=4537 RepID=A0A0E0JK94_ORYPU